MNNLSLTTKRLLKAERLQKAQLVTFKKGVFTTYTSSIFEENKKLTCKDTIKLDV